MIRALYNLGKIYEKRNGKGYEFENPNPKGYYNNILKIEFKINNNKIEYERISLEEFNIKKNDKYLYSKGTSNGGDNTPTTIISKPDTPLNKIILPLKKIEIEEFKMVLEYIQILENNKKITDEIKSFYKNKEGYILTIIINDKWIGDWKEIVNKIIGSNLERFYYRASIGTSKSENKTCFCCKENNKEVFGFVNTYNFYTVDKKGFVSGGFNQTKSWKNYPVCSDCTETLENGKKYISNNFLDKFSGITYMIIPKTIFGIKDRNTLDYYEGLLKEFENKNKLSTSNDRKNELFDNERISTEAMSNMQNNMSFNFMFYEEKNNAFKILLNIEDVLPSRLKKIFDVKDVIEKSEIYKNVNLKNDNPDMFFNFWIVRDFFSSEWDKSFLEIINSIFISKKINYQFMLNGFLRVFYNNIADKKINKDNKYIHYSTDFRKSLLILEFLIKMDLLKNKEKGGIKEMVEKTEKNKVYLNFFEEHKEVFDNDIKRAIFLEGLFVQKLLNLPEQQQSKQFYARLNGLKMNEKIIKRAFTEAVNKLNEYPDKRHYYATEKKLISEYFTSSDFSKITNDEMSYYFVLGMNLSDKFKNKEENITGGN